MSTGVAFPLGDLTGGMQDRTVAPRGPGEPERVAQRVQAKRRPQLQGAELARRVVPLLEKGVARHHLGVEAEPLSI